MKYLALCALSFAFCSATFAQTKSVETMSRQLAALGASKTTSVVHDSASNSSKLMFVADNFSNDDAKRANLMAINFATGFFFFGPDLSSAPERMLFTFWVMSKRPRFAEDHSLEFIAGQETIRIGEARYAAKPARNMEYLNYEIARKDLEQIAKQSKVVARIGNHEFTLTRGQLQGLANLLLVTDPTWQK